MNEVVYKEVTFRVGEYVKHKEWHRTKETVIESIDEDGRFLYCVTNEHNKPFLALNYGLLAMNPDGSYQK